MGSLFNEWIQLFDENNFQNLKDEPLGLRSITMLFVTIQQEFRKVEDALSNKLQTYKLAIEARNCMQVKKEPVEEETDISPPKENFKNSMNKMMKNDKPLLKSPTFDRHRKINLKKVKKPSSSINVSGVFPLNNVKSFFTPSRTDQSSKVILNASDDEDIFDSSIIGVTPNIEVTKRSKNLLQSQRKKNNSKTALRNSTLTQIFSGMVSKDEEKKDETTMMDIDEILQKVENSDKMDAGVSECENPKSVSVANKMPNSFIEDYDRIPDQRKSPVKPFVYKETVRGNEKKKLKGWSCKDCENFYKGMKLSEEELEKRMNECSKHRSRFKPEDETIPGYWDLSIPSSSEDEKTEPPESQEMSQNSLNESTIFCFYKK